MIHDAKFAPMRAQLRVLEALATQHPSPDDKMRWTQQMRHQRASLTAVSLRVPRGSMLLARHVGSARRHPQYGAHAACAPRPASQEDLLQIRTDSAWS